MTWYLNGVGQSSAVAIDPGTQTTLFTLPNNGQAYGSAIDGAGNLYLVDNINSVVIELAAGTFTPTTVVSSGLSGPTALALDGAGNLYISDTGNHQVQMVPNEQGGLNAGDMAPVTISGLSSPRGVAIDGSGNLYVADSANGNVLEVPQPGAGTQSTLLSGLTRPHGVAIDAAGNVYVTSTGQVNEYPFGGGPPITMGTGYITPHGVAVDAAGTIYVADTGLKQIIEVPAGGLTQTTLPVTLPAMPEGVVVDAFDNVYITDPSVVIEVNRTLATALSFPSTNVGSTSAPQSVEVSDAGNQALAVSSIATGTSNFTVDPSSTCSTSTPLASGGQCLIAVDFAPQAGGSPLTDALTLIDNALNNSSSAQTVQLSGSGSQLAQTIAFPTITTQTYGVAPFALNATASSHLAVNYTVTGPASVSGKILTITGVGSVTVQASQAGNSKYAAATPVSQTFTVNQAPTIVVWTQPKAITYGTALSGTQLNATATPVSEGTYVYNPTAGTVLNVGSQPLSVTFTPSDTNYAASTRTVRITVGGIQPTVHFTGAPGEADYLSTFQVTATTNASTLPVVTATPATVCKVASTNDPTTFTVNMISGTGVCSLTAKWAADNSYQAASASQMTTAEKLASIVTWNTPAPITYGTALSATQLDATASAPGKFVYSPKAGTVLTVGTQTLSVAFTPTASKNYTNATGTVSLTVNPSVTTATITKHTPNPSKAGKAVTVGFTVAQAVTSKTAPTGSVTVTASSGETCTGALAIGKGSCSLTLNTVGSITLTAAYAGDSNNNGSVSPGGVTQTVNQ